MSDNLYDAVPYFSRPYPKSHPDRLHALAAIFGLDPAGTSTCRVLEVGCASGGNLLPMAVHLPGASLVGLDLSEAQIDDARATATALGLDNVQLVHRGLQNADFEEGSFDYVIAHGVYSWVPPQVADSLLALCGRVLAPNGLAYISYNTFPGWHSRMMFREMMLYHAGDSADPARRVSQARALVDFLASSVPDGTAYAAMLAEEGVAQRAATNADLLHGMLSEHNHPCLFTEFAARARGHGLQFLAETDLATMFVEHLPAKTREVLARTRGLLDREQYLDFLTKRTFRGTLLCREEGAINRQIDGARLEGLHVAAHVRAVAGELAGNGPLRFQSRTGGTVTTELPLLKAALTVLGERRPQSMPFELLLEAARDRLGLEPAPTDTDVLGRNLISAFASQVVDLYGRPLEAACEPSERPLACPLARHMARLGSEVTNLRHELMILREPDRQLLLSCDGTSSKLPGDEERLERLARAALLVS